MCRSARWSRRIEPRYHILSPVVKDRRTTNPNDCTPLQSLRQAILPQNRHLICFGDCTGHSTNVASLPVQRLEMVGLLIPTVGGYTIEQRKPDTQQGTNPSRDLQTAFVREAASPAHRTPFAWLADRPGQRDFRRDAAPAQRDDASATRYHAATADKTPACNAACGAGSDAASAPPSPARRRDTWAVQMFAADEGVVVCWIVEQEKRAACVRSNRRHIAPETEMPC